MKSILTLLLSGALAGCATTGDLNSSGTLPYADQEAARLLVQTAQERCVTGMYREGPTKTPISGEMAVRDRPLIKRFYRSNGPWVKADTVMNGVWGSIYFDPQTSRIACGDDNWQKFRESRNLYFDEVMPETSRDLHNVNPSIQRPTNTTPTTNSPSIEARLKQLKSLRDQGLVNESEYQSKQKQILEGL